MSILSWLLFVSVFSSCLAWLAAFLAIAKMLPSLPILEHLHPPAPLRWPALSVIIPARNEGATLAPALRTILQQDYPTLQIVLVNDRSTDDTSTIIDRLAAEDPRITAIHLSELPCGWLGKTYALHCGVKRATGQWILLTDADVHFSPHAFSTAVSLVLATGGDHLALAPRFIHRSFFQEVASQAFGFLYLLFTRAPRVNSDDRKAFVGAGAFNLVRRSALDRTPGFEWLKMEVIDDVGLGMMLNRTGARSRFAVSQREVSIAWYPTLSAMVKGLEKNLFGALAYYSFSRMLIILPLHLAFVLGPLIALLFPPLSPVFLMGVLVYLCLLMGAVVAKLGFNQRLIPFLFFQVGMLLLSFMLVRSAFYAFLRNGVSWRGSWYSLQELRAAQRLKL